MRQFPYLFQSFCRSKKEDPIRENKGEKNITALSKICLLCPFPFTLLLKTKEESRLQSETRQRNNEIKGKGWKKRNRDARFIYFFPPARTFLPFTSCERNSTGDAFFSPQPNWDKYEVSGWWISPPPTPIGSAVLPTIVIYQPNPFTQNKHR